MLGRTCTMPLELYSGVTAALRELFPDMARAAANTRSVRPSDTAAVEIVSVLDPLFTTIHSLELGGSSLEARPLIS
ncbi:hypothetical protein BASA81_011224 [Batrachochytrium salamandrivorans]|nr:hypothetical protein BASA81_011224 [Batrachochytrium salamandrivorans]